MNHRAHRDHRGGGEQAAVSGVIVDAGLKVHEALGPGLLESAYEECLAHELTARGVPVRRQVPMPVMYHGMRLDAGYRLDLVVAQAVIVEIKAVEALNRLHQAQLMTYLKLSGIRVGLLLNFNTVLFKDGIKRITL